MDNKWICVRTDRVGLFTADLKDGDEVLENLGGSYPKVNYVLIDARRKWGNLPNTRPEEDIPELPEVK